MQRNLFILLLVMAGFTARAAPYRIYFIPGLGYVPEKPSPYVLGIQSEFESRGINYLTVSGSQPDNTGNALRDRLPDMLFVKNRGQRLVKMPEVDERIIKVAYGIAIDLLEHPLQPGEQLNLLGASQGTVSVAQAAWFLLQYPTSFGLDSNFRIDNLVLAGAPVHKGSRLFRALRRLEREGKIGKLLYEKYQSRNKRGRINDQVTGLAGRCRPEALLRGIGFLFDALLIRKANHPHVRASENKPTMAGFSTFAEQLVYQLQQDGIR
jgi:hypothetical protein